MSAPKVTILGGAGFVGSHLVRHLREQGCACDVPERTDDSVFRRPLGRVIYAIGLTADFRSRPLETVEAHVCLLQRLLQVADLESLTYLSSTRVYAGSTDTRESAPLRVNPNDGSDLYNLSKLMGESLCLHGGRPGLKVARLSNVVGLRKEPDIFIDQLLAEGCRTGKVVFRTAPESRKDYVHVDDAVRLVGQIALSEATGIYNIASGEGITNGEIAEALRSGLGFEVSTVPDASAWEFTAIDISKARDHFAYRPRKFADYFPGYLQDYQRFHCA